MSDKPHPYGENFTEFSAAMTAEIACNLGIPRETLDAPIEPVELVRRAIRYSSARGDLVADLFTGSGTTLAAAHLEKRVFVGTELDPRYADVICRRFATLAGIEPVRADGKTFSHVEKEAA